ncbi:MAG: glycerol-3-phosphate dehydrogenase/oxidase [Spirochaetia bacterium]|nr:glycerol-3-phosphate dehydrogenase/oxidase [Spirochaetia bacterium]
MKRDIEALKNNKFDVLIIGGGITGAAIAWDAALRGLKVALIEKNDFGHATSSATSKMIHGGLRYLENFEFSVVRESLRERRLLEKNIPHIAFPLPFLLPVYDYLPISRFLLKTGLFFYDLLSFDKNELPYSEKFLPNHQWVSKETVTKLEPRINTRGLKGGYLYYDVLNKFPERSNMEYILSASEKNAVIANYVEFQSFIFNKSNTQKVEGVYAIDKLTNQEFKIESDIVINAGGPWVDKVLSKLSRKTPQKIVRSKGIHLLLPRINKDCALTFSTKDNKHFFIIPWLNYTLIGTTDDKFTGDLDDVKVTKSEAQELLNLVKSYYPADVGLSSVVHAYAGIRPLVVGDENESTYSVSRKHEIIDHQKTDNIAGLFSVIGGKWTTSRALAEIMIDRVFKKSNKNFIKSKTKNTPLVGGRFKGSFENALTDAIKKTNSSMDPKLTEHLFSYYGCEYEKIVARIESNIKSKKYIDKVSFLTVAEIEHAVEYESAVKLSDFLMRRNNIGNTGVPEPDILREITDAMGNLLGWNAKMKTQEISEYLSRYQLDFE